MSLSFDSIERKLPLYCWPIAPTCIEGLASHLPRLRASRFYESDTAVYICNNCLSMQYLLQHLLVYLNETGNTLLATDIHNVQCRESDESCMTMSYLLYMAEMEG